ncbi:MAG: hypothetical protein K2J77_04610 [Oscillospiraceae bacterium]|nr:hypothetical protein [Oscillospiraceae bacterium]
MENAVDIVEEHEAEIEIIERHSPIAIAPAADKPNTHVRVPELHRHAAKLVMAIAALLGAAAGLRLSLGEANAATRQIIAEASAGTFGAVFLRQLAAGAVFLAAELVLGFFAFGDYLVWSAPFIYTAGAAARLAATSPKQIPGTLIAVAAVILGAAFSSELSSLLLRLTSGGTVHTGDSPRREIAIKFAGCLAAVILAAILNAALRS